MISSESCKACLPGTNCTEGATLATLQLRRSLKILWMREIHVPQNPLDESDSSPAPRDRAIGADDIWRNANLASVCKPPEVLLA